MQYAILKHFCPFVTCLHSHIVHTQGLGNAFLSNISACDAIFHCISKSSTSLFLIFNFIPFFRTGVFEDDDVTHVDGDVNPVRDLETIHDELRLKDQQYCTNRIVSLTNEKCG